MQSPHNPMVSRRNDGQWVLHSQIRGPGSVRARGMLLTWGDAAAAPYHAREKGPVY